MKENIKQHKRLIVFNLIVFILAALLYLLDEYFTAFASVSVVLLINSYAIADSMKQIEVEEVSDDQD